MLTIVCCVGFNNKSFLYINFPKMIKSKIAIKFGNRVRELRQKKGLSQEQFAELVNVHRTYIGMIERAEKNITLLNIEKIAIALKMKIKDLFENIG